MIQPFRLTLNKGVLVVADFVFCSSRLAVLCDIWVVDDGTVALRRWRR